MADMINIDEQESNSIHFPPSILGNPKTDPTASIALPVFLSAKGFFSLFLEELGSAVEGSSVDWRRGQILKSVAVWKV